MSVNQIKSRRKEIPPKATDLFTLFSDEKSIFLFKAICVPNLKVYRYNHVGFQTSSACAVPFDIRELSGYKKYHDTLIALTELNLIERENETRYRVTNLGKAVCDALFLVEDAVKIQDRLEIIDSLDAHREIPHAERKRIIERLIDNKEIQRILIKKDFEED